MSNCVATVHVQSIQSLPDVLAEATALVKPGTRFGFSRTDGYRTITMPRPVALSVAEKFNDLVVVSPPPAPRHEPTPTRNTRTRLVDEVGPEAVIPFSVSVTDNSGNRCQKTRTKPSTPQSRSRNKGENDG